MAFRTRSQLATEIPSLLPDNTVGTVTPTALRTLIQDVVDSTATFSTPVVLEVASRAVAITTSIDSAIPVLRVAGYATTGDGGAARYARLSSTPSPAKAWHFQSADGAWWELAETRPSIGMFGASTSAADNATPIRACIDYAIAKGVRAYVPGGTYLTGQIVVPAYTNLVGDSEQTSILKLKNGANQTLFIKENDSAYHVSVERIQFHGNRANNTSGDGVDLSGVGVVLEHIIITEVKQRGLVISAVFIGSSFLDGLGHLQHIQIENIGGHGFHFVSGADYRIHDMHVNNPALENSSSYGLYVQGNARWTAIHVSNADSSSGIGTPAIGSYFASTGNDVSSSHFECGVTACQIAGDGNQFAACRFYAPDGAIALFLTGSYNNIRGSVGIVNDSAFPNYEGLHLGYTGLAPIANLVDLVDYGANLCAVNFHNSGGRNIIRGSGYVAAGGAFMVGTPVPADDITLSYAGPGGGSYRQDPRPSISYLPTITPAGGSMTVVVNQADYVKIGFMVHVIVDFTISAVGTGTGNISITLPVAALGGYGSVRGRETVVSGYEVDGVIAGSGAAAVHRNDGTTAIAAGARINALISYRASV
jgi:hypothetical protein